MFYRKCEGCGCSLDPGEGRMCSECIQEIERKRARDEFLGIMLMADGSEFEQMGMEEILNGK